MIVTAELSLYPLTDGYLDRIEALIRDLDGQTGLDIRVNQMSTQVRGELSDVMQALADALAAAFADGEPQALVAKFVNADLPIHVPPEL